MVRLFLNNKEVELDKSVIFAINKQFEDITSPTDIKNDWSKTVQIPFTQSNNKLFGELFNVDRLIVDGDSTLMGIYFNPYKKVDFRLQWGNAIIMQGYAKNIDISRSANGKGHYNITLNGELGKVFQEMKKITFDTTTDDIKYLIDGSKYVNQVINKELVHKLWNNEPNLDDLDLFESTNSKYRIQDYIGFIPNNSYDDDFDYKIFQKDFKSSKPFAEVLNDRANNIEEGTNYAHFTGIDAETVIGEGLLPREIGEYRSYMQIPYIYFNKLFQIFTKKTEEITGYSVHLDTTWFNNSNPYWNKMAYILEKFNTKEEYSSYEGVTEPLRTSYFLLNNSGGILQQPNTYVPKSFEPIYSTFSNQIIDDVRQEFLEDKIDTIIINKQSYPFRLTVTNPYDYNNEQTGTTTDKIILNQGSRLYVVFRLLNENREPVALSRNVIINENYDGGSINGDWNIVKIPALTNKGGRTWSVDFNVNFEFLIDRQQVGSNFYIDVASYFENLTVYYFYLNKEDVYLKNRIVPQTITVEMLGNTKFDLSTNNTYKRSGANFTLNDLWNKEFNLFDEIINYCKQYRIGVFCDDINKVLTFKPLSSYFNNYKVLDWTDKLDLSKEYHIQPITFDNKYLLFNYEKYDTELNTDYNEKYGRNFGEYRLTTDYEFNNSEKKLFNNAKVAIPSTDICLSWSNLYDKMKIIYTLPAEITTYNKDKDKKNQNVFGSMLFYNGLVNFDDTSAMRLVNISDDTYLQAINQTYFYAQNGQEDKILRTYKYPLLDIVESDNLCTFTIPNENYTYLKDNYDNKPAIYHNFWENYLNERYNKQNKIVTCYLRLTPYDIANFQYNNFVKIQNQLYMVNKIYDYNIDENQTTKVDLITIQDIKGYTDTNFKLFNIYNDKYQKWNYYRDYITLTEVGMTKTIYITSTSDITWKDESLALQGLKIYYNNDISNATNGGGVIPAGELVPVTFIMDDREDEFGDIVFSNGKTDIRVSVALVVDTSFVVYDSDKTEWTSTDKIELQNTNPLEKTIYITSPNSDVHWTAVDSSLQDLYISYNNDKSTEKSGSGFIPSGNLVPVTFRMDKEGDVSTINSKIRFTTERQTTDIDVRLIYNEIFKVYRWDGELWNEDFDYILLDSSDSIKTIYLTANSDVTWTDTSAELQNLYINAGGDEEDWGEYTNGSGTIYAPSNMKPIHFRFDTQGQEVGSVGDIILFNGRHEWKIGVRLA